MYDVNTILWTTMIRGYTIRGYNKNSLKLFDLMKHLGTNPNNITFVYLVDKGCKYLNP